MVVNKKLKIVGLILALIFILSACTQTSEPLAKTEYLLGTIVTVKLYDHQNDKTLTRVFNRLQEIEDRMSVNIEGSDIDQVNKNAGIKPVEVHEDVYFVLKKAKEYAHMSDGAFDPTIGPLVKLWSIGTEEERVPAKEEVEAKLNKVDFNKMILLEDNKVYLDEKGMRIDLGGIAKGYAADETRRILEEAGVDRAIIDLGGNAFVKGTKPGGEAWKVGIQNPFSETRGSRVGIVLGTDITVVTSGNYERYFMKDGKRYHHILDRKTGYPAENEVAGISVIAKESIDADALSTALFVLGVDKGMALVKTLEDVEVIFITKNQKIYLSPGIKDKFTIDNDAFELANP